MERFNDVRKELKNKKDYGKKSQKKKEEEKNKDDERNRRRKTIKEIARVRDDLIVNKRRKMEGQTCNI